MRALLVILTLSTPALAGPGFEGVGGSSNVPAFSDPEAVVEDEERLLALVERYEPEQHARLLRLREVDRAAYVMAMTRVAKLVHRARDDPAYGERLLAIQSKSQQLKDLAKSYRTLSEDERIAARAELERLASEILDLKQQDRRERLEELRARLEQLQAEFDERERDRERVVDEYVDDLLRERSGL